MKNSKIKILPIIGAVALLAGCSDDLDVRQIVPGEEIHFGVTGSFESGNPQARTIYGDVVNDTTIQINWVPNEDIIDIAYPEAAQKKLIAYDVLTSEDHTTDPSKSTAQILAPHEGEPMGLQWGTPTNGYHHFYAVYPSSKMFGQGQIDGSITIDANGLNGYMPNAQDPKAVKPNTKGVDYYIEPDMRYAYMVAQTAHKQDAGDKVSLDFHPLVTALEFTVIAAEVENNVSAGKMTLQGIRLQSVNKNNICGKFSYKFQDNANYTVTDANVGASGFDQIYMDIPNGIELTKDKKFNFTFFVLPTKEYKAKDLTLTFVYRDNSGNLTYKTAAINKNIAVRKKYFFNNVSLKAISSNAQPSKWFSMLDENILINQLSIPVAGNAFTNDYSDTDAAYHKQQVTDYMKLWNQGVRGFELVTEWAEGATAFGQQHFVGGEKVLDSSTSTPSPTFDTVVRQLVSFKKSEATKNETLILICHCHPVKCDVNGQSYVTNLMAYFQSLIDDGTLTLDDFVLLTENSTVHDLKGKISIIIRPGDDLYFKWTWTETTSDGTKISKTSDDIDLSGFSIPALLIKDWGSAYDRWDKRYVGAVREATWADATGVPETEIRIENLLYGISSAERNYTAVSGYDFSSNAWPSPLTGVNRYSQSTNNGTAYVQEWCRVVPAAMNNKEVYGGAYSRQWELISFRYRYLWCKWPSSIQEKKDDIDALFRKSVNEHPVCINVLSGYYITENHKVSLVPFKRTMATDKATIEPSGQGNGGNYAGLAADLNTYVYEQLQNDAYGVGPLGLVQIDFIGATKEQFDAYDTDNYNTNHAAAATASQNLVPFIAMNNFRFPMKRADVQMGTSNEKVDQTIEGE